ncbi:MAG TPA: HAMP domain-containing protein, partial [Bacteroidetes bacterium]|nr:HAMP domain-containing protein [Bacteroidota bacterium]HEX05082.1 HAMP domain-containing protein [Bacteroidota bacterium]
VLFSSLLAGGITRTIMRSVRELRQGTERLRKGDLEVQIEPRGNDELGDLAISFNEMTSDLRRMISEVTIKERLEREIEIARRIQIHLLPTVLPERPTLQVGAHSDPAFEVGGDYYDCIDLGEKGLLVVLGDVSGKGVGAAVLMSNLQASLSLLATQNLPMNEMVRQLNVQVCKNSTPEMFITFFAGLFDPEREILTYVNAGHDVPFLIRRGKPISLEIGGMLLGIMEDGEYTSAEIDIHAGDLFAAYSDGLTEAMNDSDVEFGRDRLIQTMDEFKHLDPHLLVTKVLQTIRDYAGHERAGRDDLTLITVKVIES